MLINSISSGFLSYVFFCLQCYPERCHPVNLGHLEECLKAWMCILTALEVSCVQLSLHSTNIHSISVQKKQN